LISILVFLVRRHDVDRLRAHHAHDVLAAVDDHALGGERLRIESADRVEADEALVIDVGDDEADLVHVGGGHDFFGGRAAFFQGDHVADVVGADVVGEASSSASTSWRIFFS
jgi:hypothetical protein